MIVIVDYGMGNLGSIANMFSRIDIQATISRDVEAIAAATKLVLPGVGAFDQGMSSLRAFGLEAILDDRVRVARVPVLGICLGMQLLTRGSEEGTQPGLGWVPASTMRFRPEPQSTLKVPHMGWNTVELRKPSPLFDEMYEEPRFYFVHSFYVACERAEDVLTATRYGGEFCSALQAGHVFGVQFHPEKSHKFGMKLLRNFATL